MYNNTHLQLPGTSVVYWIRRPFHKDVTTQGYVGITNQSVESRWQAHKLAATKNIEKKCVALNNAIRKHSDLVYDVLLVADSREYCERIENLLRPRQRIGWNIAIGGLPVDTALGGEATKNKWIQYWIANPTKAADRWWDAEMRLMTKQAIEHRKTTKPKPHTQDRQLSKRNKSGYQGVTWFNNYSLWRAQIGFIPQVITLGYFQTPEEAYEAYKAAKVIHAQWKNGAIDRNEAIALVKSTKKIV